MPEEGVRVRVVIPWSQMNRHITMSVSIEIYYHAPNPNRNRGFDLESTKVRSDSAPEDLDSSMFGLVQFVFELVRIRRIQCSLGLGFVRFDIVPDSRFANIRILRATVAWIVDVRYISGEHRIDV